MYPKIPGDQSLLTSFQSQITCHQLTPIQIDLTKQPSVQEFFDKYRPEYVFVAAAKVGGILANNTYKADFIYENLAIAVNVIHSAYKYGTKKLLNLGSSCIYPRESPQPMKEEYLLSGRLESTNEPYAVAKISAIKLCRYFNEQYGTNFVSLMPTNLYGPNDNYNLETAHVLPALIRKFHLAKLLERGDLGAIRKDFQKHPIGFGLDNKIDFEDNQSILKALAQLGISSQFTSQLSPLASHVSVTLWGSGEVFREFLHVDDLADACLYVMETIEARDICLYCKDYFVNIGAGEEIKVKDLALLIKETVGFKGEIVHDLSKPDGTPRKLLDVSKMKQLGWEAKIGLREGIRKTYEWYLHKA
jgi:GDP-L-fucose synthase